MRPSVLWICVCRGPREGGGASHAWQRQPPAVKSQKKHTLPLLAPALTSDRQNKTKNAHWHHQKRERGQTRHPAQHGEMVVRTT